MVIGENNVGILIDRSGSMRGLEEKVVETVNSWVDKIKEESYKGGIKTTVSFAVFDDVVDVVIDRSPVDKLRRIERKDITPRNMTRLCYASVEMMKLMTKGMHNANETYLFIVATDGGENASPKKYIDEFKTMIKENALSGSWTIVFLCPPGSKRELIQWGLYDDNIMEWEGRSGMEYSRVQTCSSLGNYYTGLTTGQRSTTKFFEKVTTDMGNVKVATVKAKLQDETRNYMLIDVPKEAVIAEFVTSKGISYYAGRAFYQLMKAEKVQVGKNILVMDKASKNIYGGQYARDLIGLDDPNTNYKVTPGNHANYEIFVQSKSVNRILPRGTKILVHR